MYEAIRGEIEAHLTAIGVYSHIQFHPSYACPFPMPQLRIL